MSDQTQYPTIPQSMLSRDDVVNYLLGQRHRGYEVFQDSHHTHILILVLDERYRINFVMASGCQIQGIEYGTPFKIANVTTMTELRSAVDLIAQQAIGGHWLQSITRARVSENEPATNFVSIANLIGSSSVEAIFDPYLENRSLTSLLDILSFGSGSIANGVRVLSTNKTTMGQIPRLTKVGFDAWLTQLGINGEIRIMSATEHRRFLLLSGSQSLLLGQSLNAIHKNEAIRLEPDTQDRAFFEQVWSKATPLS